MMRTLYVIMGMLLGAILTIGRSASVIAGINQTYERDFTVASLTGYHEGWQRGREFTDKMNAVKMFGLIEELSRCRAKGSKCSN